MEFTQTPADTLVLKITEYENGDCKKPDTRLYILYDKREHTYIIRGRRTPCSKFEAQPYSYQCERVEDLADFIEFLICRGNAISYDLMNYDNLPAISDEIHFDFLYTYDDRAYELTAYDNKKLKRKELIRYLRMLRNVFNYY
jgi:hypothetical protein